MKNKIKRIFILLLAFAAVITTLPVSHAEAAGFPDVSEGEWYYDNIKKLSDLGILNGYPDGTFRPNANLKRAEFLHMVVTVAEIWSDKAPTGIHWAESDWNALKDAGILDVSFYGGTDAYGNVKEYTEPMFKCTAAALDANISRYEMAYILNGVLYSAFYENQMELKNQSDSYANYIKDYNQLAASYRAPVEQVFSKGILTGYEDSSFCGGNALTRAEAAAVIVRLAWSSQRKAQTFAVEKEVETVDPTTSFAFRYRNMSTAERRLALFGDANKSYFTSAADAGSHIVPVTVQTWDINSFGAKYTRTWTLYVNVLVVDEVKGIFEYIYNDPEKFPIHALGGARYSDTMRHSWGCAIDINPVENYYIHYASGQQVGTCCWKNASSYPNIDSRYCITPDSSVVKAFAKYGWGWGGQGWTSAADYMHFSILASGG